MIVEIKKILINLLVTTVLLFIPVFILSQQIISQTDFHTGLNGETIKDKHGNYLMGLFHNTSADSLKIGDTAHRVIWLNRMGGLEEAWLWDIQLDSEKNFVMNGITSSFNFNATSSLHRSGLPFRLYTETGILTMAGILDHEKKEPFSPLKNLAPGMYLLHLAGVQHSLCQKLIIQ